MPPEYDPPPLSADWGKLVLCLAVIASVVALTITDHLADTAAATTLGTIVGYVFGNGKAMRRGEPVGPMLYRRERREQPSDGDV